MVRGSLRPAQELFFDFGQASVQGNPPFSKRGLDVNPTLVSSRPATQGFISSKKKLKQPKGNPKKDPRELQSNLHMSTFATALSATEEPTGGSP